MPGMEIYIPDYKEDVSQEEYERWEKVRPEQRKPEVKTGVMTEEELNEIPF